MRGGAIEDVYAWRSEDRDDVDAVDIDSDAACSRFAIDSEDDRGTVIWIGAV